MTKLTTKRGIVAIFALLTGWVLFASCSHLASKPQVVRVEVVRTVEVEKLITPTPKPEIHARYIFLFIGDGMGVPQRTIAELYLLATKGAGAQPEDTRLLMNTFPAQGINTTRDLKGVTPDSASAATAMATGHKTWPGVISMNLDEEEAYQTIAEAASARGLKVGIISSTSLDHATPAAFYAHQPSRYSYYKIGVELANSNFDYFAGGPLNRPRGKDNSKPDSIEMARVNGYSVVNTRADFEKLAPGVGKVLIMGSYPADNNSLPYEMDRSLDDISLAEYVAKGIELLDNPKGFFMMVEGGKIDFACHTNDAAAAIHDTLALDSAIAEAVKFYEKHPEETLIVATGDHETGGLVIGGTDAKYKPSLEKLQAQKISQAAFSNKVVEWRKAGNITFKDTLPFVEENFGILLLSEAERADLQAKAEGGDREARAKLEMTLSEPEIEFLRQSFADSMSGKEQQAGDNDTFNSLYGGYEPFAIGVTTILNYKAGISWASHAHTGLPAQTSALGVGHELFNGYYDQADIHAKMMAIAGF